MPFYEYICSKCGARGEVFVRSITGEVTPPKCPDGGRQKGHEMTRIMELDTAWLLTDTRIRNALQQRRVIGYTKHPVLHAEWMYLDLE